jgi:hypothetical protein
MLYEFVGNTSAQVVAGATQFTVNGNSVLFPGHNAFIAGYEFYTAAAPPSASGVVLGTALTARHPAGYTNLYQLYHSARVFSTRIEIEVDPLTTLAARVIVVPFNTAITAPVVTTPELALAQPFAKSIIVRQANYGSMNTISHRAVTATILGVPPLAVANEDDFAVDYSVSTAPVRNWAWSIWCEPLDGLTAAYAVSVKMFLDVEWFARSSVVET